MRPLGEISEAILDAARRLSVEVDGVRRGGTLREISHQARVSVVDGRQTIGNLCRSGRLQAVAVRKVSYRNRPVAEYSVMVDPPAAPAHAEIAAVFATWRGPAA